MWHVHLRKVHMCARMYGCVARGLLPPDFGGCTSAALVAALFADMTFPGAQGAHSCPSDHIYAAGDMSVRSTRRTMGLPWLFVLLVADLATWTRGCVIRISFFMIPDPTKFCMSHEIVEQVTGCEVEWIKVQSQQPMHVIQLGTHNRNRLI